eukprot:scaffold1054_cov124-Cylindrotheca_fusiformis.AAC.9
MAGSDSDCRWRVEPHSTEWPFRKVNVVGEFPLPTHSTEWRVRIVNVVRELTRPVLYLCIVVLNRVFLPENPLEKLNRRVSKGGKLVLIGKLEGLGKSSTTHGLRYIT